MESQNLPEFCGHRKTLANWSQKEAHSKWFLEKVCLYDLTLSFSPFHRPARLKDNKQNKNIHAFM